ncbi:hypothetical protein [Actinacidiphila paucisporea]|uniref:Uncharacterized protein n=1 Tax=Actinacidiphila paucisporea TaxID=310782 RepID=A0A1M6TJM1_9ACTN|nr:hypothetical protein [Actinacidiphila paucisporea]SHK57096.1 hypothetical protein SAMN05216499_10166 [Actinacidiphila paucisporea]
MAASEPGSAGDALNGAQQIADAVGAASISRAYLSITRTSTAVGGLAACSAIVLVCVALYFAALPLLPRTAADTH